MIRLLALRAFITIWACAISLSDKLSAKTWELLVVLQCVIFILSAGGLGASLSDSASTHVTGKRVPVDSKSLLSSDLRRRPDVASARKRRRALATTAKGRSSRKAGRNSTAPVAARRLYALKRGYVRRTGRPLLVMSYRRSAASQAHDIGNNVGDYSVPNMLAFNPSSAATGDFTSAYGSKLIRPPGALNNIFPDFGRFVAPRLTVTLKLSPSEDGDYKKTLLFWVSLFGLIVSPVSAISTAVVAWISLHRGRADELLKQVQIEKMRLEIEQLRSELTQTRPETEPPPARIVIADW